MWLRFPPRAWPPRSGLSERAGCCLGPPMSTKPCSTGNSAISSGPDGRAWGAVKTSPASVTSGPSRSEAPGSSSSGARTDECGPSPIPVGTGVTSCSPAASPGTSTSSSVPITRGPIGSTVRCGTRRASTSGPRSFPKRTVSWSFPPRSGTVWSSWRPSGRAAPLPPLERPSRRARRGSSMRMSPGACGWRPITTTSSKPTGRS